MKIDELSLQCGNDIPFPQAQITIHQPSIKEIGYIGEENFHIGSHFLVFDRNHLTEEDKTRLANKSDFEIFMSAMNSSDKAKHKTNAIMVLALLFPNYKIKIEHNQILLHLENFSSSINEQNFDSFEEILNQIFCLNIQEGEFNPSDALAAKIAEKIKKGQQKRAKKNENLTNISIYSKYISILSIGLKKDKNILNKYTIYQLRDEFERFQLKENYDVYVQAKLAGAQNLEEVKNWMDDLHS